MTRSELLAATGSVWEVQCFVDGNCRRKAGLYYVRAANADRAKVVAKRLSSCRVAVAWPWNPEKDLRASGWIRKVSNEAQKSA
jgi:hypothetical protein